MLIHIGYYRADSFPARCNLYIPFKGEARLIIGRCNNKNWSGYKHDQHHEEKSPGRSIVAALGMMAVGNTFAANVPAGVQLAEKQVLVRNNGSEPQSLDPHKIEVSLNQISHAIY